MPSGPVVAGTDGSEESLLAVEWASREAVLHRLPLRLVAVLATPPRIAPASTAATLSAVARRRLERALAAAADRAAGLAPGLKVTAELLAGPPARTLAGATRD